MVKIVDMTSALQQVRESDAYDNQRYMMKKYMGQILARPDNSDNKDGKDHVYAPNPKIAKQLYSQGKKVYREDLNKDDEKTIKPIIKQLQKSVKSHDKQAKQLTKDISDEKDLEEQAKELEEQLKTAEKELEELYIKEDKAYVIRFQRIADKERMVVVFKKQSEADMYADNIKKQGGKVFSNKLEKIPYKVVDRKSK